MIIMKKNLFEISYIDLIRANKEKDDCRINVRLAVIGDSSTQHLSTAVSGYGKIRDFGIKVYDAGYKQEKALIMNPKSELYDFCPDYVWLYWSVDSMYLDYQNTKLVDRESFAENKIEELDYLTRTVLEHNITVLQNSIPEFNDNIFGSFSLKTSNSFIYQIKKFNYLLMQRMATHRNVFPIDMCSLSAKIGRNTLCDNKMLVLGDISVSIDNIPYVAKLVVDVILAVNGRVKKCIVLDLDNTLWGGVVGEDGWENLQIGNLGVGKAFVCFQKYLKELKDRGILLAIVSKNDEEVARSVFVNNKDMILTLDDFVLFYSNWDDKASNIEKIATELNLGLDSIVFIDDSEFERNVVKRLLPDVEVPEMPKDPCDYVSYLIDCNLFETSSVSAEDSERTNQYKKENLRKKEEVLFGDYESYLNSLDMKCVSAEFDSFHIPRIAQLSQRSNQFNFRTIRMTEEDVSCLVNNSRYITRYFELCDRFGDYGLVGYIVLKKQDQILFIDNWVMSCRVLKRTVEEFILNEIFKIANDCGYSKVCGEYKPTTKNGLVKDLYKNNGFENIDNIWQLDTSSFIETITYVKKENDHERK